jgi:hypothetical protein
MRRFEHFLGITSHPALVDASGSGSDGEHGP